jgi:arginine exporter protein ArgO
MKKMNNRQRKKFILAAVLELVLVVGIVLFWVAFFTADETHISDPRLKEKYLAFESAFPVPDAYLSVVLIIGSIGLWRKKSYGRLFSLIGGASLIFLGLLDISFNTQHGIYSLGLGEAVLNLFINLICLGVGVFLVLTVWKYREDLP